MRAERQLAISELRAAIKRISTPADAISNLTGAFLGGPLEVAVGELDFRALISLGAWTEGGWTISQDNYYNGIMSSGVFNS